MDRPPLPHTWNPNSSLTEYDRNGQRVRRRFYDGDGRAIKNIDYLPHHGHPVPHAHDWDWSRDPARQPARPLKPGE
jgi:hypothetical protein